MTMHPTDVDALTLDRRSGEVHRLNIGEAEPVELLGRIPARAVRKITDRLRYAPGVVPLVLTHGFPPVLCLLNAAGEPQELPEDAAGPVMAVVAYSALSGVGVAGTQ